MKLSTGQIYSFLQAPDQRVGVILLYGPDAGLVRERADLLAKKVAPDLGDPFRVSLLSGSSLTEDPARLGDEALTPVFGGGKRLVRLQQAGENVVAGLQNLLKNPPSSDICLVLIEASDLDKRSKLRALCESADPFVCAIPCYVEDAGQRQRTITEILRAENLSVPRDALLLLAEILPPDRIAVRSELEKLALYAKGANAVTVEDILAVLHNASAAEMDDLVHAIANGDARKAGVLIDHLFAEQTSPVALLRAAQRHFLRLQLARSYCDNGASASEAIKKLQPPVFWKYVEPITRQVQRWPSAKIENLLQKLYETEAAVKQTDTPDAALCAQVLLKAAVSV